MLKNIQIKIVLIFLVIGIVIIGTMGYINYTNLQKLIEVSGINDGDYGLVLQGYQNNLKFVTIGAICGFMFACILARYFCNSESDFTNFETN